jgi:hypothetical protein
MADKIDRPMKVAPDSVRVWRGYRNSEYATDRSGFIEKLGSIFIPITVQMMAPMGMTAYLPAVVPQDACPQTPDEIALVFYKSQETYNTASRKTTGGRAYGELHSAVFNFDKNGGIPPSQSGFPVLMRRKIAQGAPYYLFDNEADWYYGITDVFVGARPDSLSTGDFLSDIYKAMSDIQKDRPKGLEGLIFTASGDILIFWAHWESASMKNGNLLSELKKLLRVIIDASAKNTEVPVSPDEIYPGLDVKEGDCLTLRFRRQY